MKIAGIPERLLWFSWFLSSIIICVIVSAGVTYFLRKDVVATDVAIFSHVRASVLWLCISLFYIAQIAFCFMFAAIFHAGKFYVHWSIQQMTKSQ